ncbi:MAG: hypothetical protein OXK79_11335 [Chloroflexota bacterium]|nr:hypothetical protein [Chloroflexota bacterium]
MSRNVQIVLLCEDRQHETFCRRFLTKAGWPVRHISVEIAPRGRGSGEQFVRNRFPEELEAYRRRNHHVSVTLLVMVDGDNQGVERRVAELDAACRERNIPCRDPGEQVLVFVPTWRIETWLAYLGGETVDEGRRDYPRLPRPRECRPHVDSLAAMCQRGRLREPAPSSLRAACTEYRRWPGAMPGG